MAPRPSIPDGSGRRRRLPRAGFFRPLFTLGNPGTGTFPNANPTDEFLTSAG